jgi:hypothetical protein
LLSGLWICSAVNCKRGTTDCAGARRCCAQFLRRGRSDVFVGTGIPDAEIVWIARAALRSKENGTRVVKRCVRPARNDNSEVLLPQSYELVAIARAPSAFPLCAPTRKALKRPSLDQLI